MVQLDAVGTLTLSSVAHVSGKTVRERLCTQYEGLPSRTIDRSISMQEIHARLPNRNQSPDTSHNNKQWTRYSWGGSA
jgi:hypothetical protein